MEVLNRRQDTALSPGLEGTSAWQRRIHGANRGQRHLQVRQGYNEGPTCRYTSIFGLLSSVVLDLLLTNCDQESSRKSLVAVNTRHHSQEWEEREQSDVKFIEQTEDNAIYD